MLYFASYWPNSFFIGSDDGLAKTNRPQASISANDGPVYQGIYASLGIKELTRISKDYPACEMIQD